MFCSGCFRPVFNIGAGRNAFYFFKLLIKVRNIIEAAVVANPRDIHFVLEQQLAGMPDPDFV